LFDILQRLELASLGVRSEEGGGALSVQTGLVPMAMKTVGAGLSRATPHSNLPPAPSPMARPPTIQFDMWSAQSQSHQIKHGQKAKPAKHQFKTNTKPSTSTTNHTDQTRTTSSSTTPKQTPQDSHHNNNLHSASSPMACSRDLVSHVVRSISTSPNQAWSKRFE
jgi:hypothetical protein